MSATIISGKEISAKLRGKIKEETHALIQSGITPGLAVILVGSDPASTIYVNNKEKACAECGFYSEKHVLPADTTQDELLHLIERLNNDPKIHGILCQLPLPEHISEEAVIRTIRPEKDVDAFHPVNVGKIMVGDYDFLPCTPAGVMELLAAYDIPVRGKRCVVIGRSSLVGQPLSTLLTQADGTVSLCHSKTPDLAAYTREADILVSAVGRTGLVTADMVKPGAAVIDVAMNRGPDGKLSGDVDFGPVTEKAAFITPVPGGVGPMTRAMLMRSVLYAAKLHRE